MSISKTVIRSMRRERGWSQDQLAAISGLSERTIQRIETNGDCALDSKMALASAFDVSPAEFDAAVNHSNDTNEIDWQAAVGVIFILLAFPCIAYVLTTSQGKWEVACLLIVDGLTIVMSTVSHGFRETIELMSDTILKKKNGFTRSAYVRTIMHARLICQNAYIIGFVTALTYMLVILMHANERLDQINIVLVEAAIPVLYAILLIEFWIRPYKHRMEKYLSELSSGAAAS